MTREKGDMSNRKSSLVAMLKKLPVLKNFSLKCDNLFTTLSENFLNLSLTIRLK